MTPQDRLAAALPDALSAMTEGTEHAPAPTPSDEPGSDYVVGLAESILAADPSIAADMELGGRIRDADDPIIETWLRKHGLGYPHFVAVAANLRAALTEGEK